MNTPEERQRHDYMARFDGDLKPYRADWFGIEPAQWPAFADEYRRHELNIYSYEPFCEYRHPARVGNFINYSPHGYRSGVNQAAWPPDDSHYVVFFFGGSTTLAVGPDWTSIPSHLQTILDNRKVQGRPIRIYNFGRGAYFSSLEVALFNNLLREGYRCDLAIFLDGINDPYFHHGIPPTASVYQAAITDMNKTIAAETRSARRADIEWIHLRRFWSSLPAFKLLDLAARWIDRNRGLARTLGAPTRPSLTEKEVQVILDRYAYNIRNARTLADSHTIKTLFVWQPSPAYDYDLSNHVALADSGGDLLGHERADTVYSALIENREIMNDPHFLWLGNMQSKKNEPLYVDTVHYTTEFSHEISAAIASSLETRGML